MLAGGGKNCVQMHAKALIKGFTSFSVCLQELSVEQVDHTHGWACVPLITTLSDEHRKIRILTDKSAINYCVVYCLSSLLVYGNNNREKKKLYCDTFKVVSPCEWMNSWRDYQEMIYSPLCPSKIVDFFFSFVEDKRRNSKECVDCFCPYNESQWGTKQH